MAENSNFNEYLNPCIQAAVCVRMENQQTIIGFALHDSERYILELCEFRDSEHLSVFESVLLQALPSTCIVLLPESQALAARLKTAISSCGVEIIEKSKVLFDGKYIEQDVGKIIEGNIKNHVSLLSHKLGTACLSVLIKDSNLCSSTIKYRLKQFPVSSLMRMDEAAFAALSILPTKGQGTRTNQSVYGMLNKCKTPIGSRKLRIWLTQPLVDIAAIEHRQKAVTFFINHTNVRQRVNGEILRKIPDLDKISHDLHNLNCGLKVKMSLETLVHLYDSVIESKNLLELLDETTSHKSKEDVRDTLYKPLKSALDGFLPFIKLIEYSVDLEEVQNGNYLISRAFCSTLKTLAEERDAIRDSMNLHRASVEATIGLSNKPLGRKAYEGDSSLKLVDASQLGMVFRVTKKEQPLIQKHGNKFLQVRINKNEYLFTTKELRSINERYGDAVAAYDKEQTQLLRKVQTVAATFWPAVENLSTALSSIDVLSAFAIVALSAPASYCLPTLEEGCEELILIGSRHALLECQSRQSNFIQNDIVMNKQISRLQIVTGPNMGGKSTYIRQIALTALMAQVGSYVPCRSAKLPIFHHIMCRVGASDIQLKGISTFMAEMVEAATILRSADENSLVIVDELGRGTSTYEGFGIAWAIAKTIAEKLKCFCLFATHFHEMASLSREITGVGNKYVTADIVQGKLQFKFLIKDGSADQSYGIHVAELAALPQEIIRRAKHKSEELEDVENHFMSTEIPSQSHTLKKIKILGEKLMFVKSSQDFIDAAKTAKPEIEQVLMEVAG